MAEGRQRDAWNRDASLMALIANCHRNPEKRSQPFQPGDFNPFTTRDQLVRPRVDEEDADIQVLKTIFVDRRPTN